MFASAGDSKLGVAVNRKKKFPVSSTMLKSPESADVASLEDGTIEKDSAPVAVS